MCLARMAELPPRFFTVCLNDVSMTLQPSVQKIEDERSFNITPTDLGRRTASGVATAVLTQAVRMLVQLAGMAILARILAPNDFGVLAMATTVTLFVGIFADLGLSVATVQRNVIDQSTVSTLFYVNVAVGCVLALVCFATAPLLTWAFGDPRVSFVAMALGASIPISAAGAQHAALLQRSMRWAPLQWTPIIAQTLGAIVAILLAWQTAIGYWALVAQLWVNSVVSTTALWYFRGWRPSGVPRWHGASPSLPFGFHLAGSYFISYFQRQFDKILVGERWGAAAVGYYSRAYQLFMLPYTLVEGPIASAVIPALSRVQHDPERWRNAYLRAFAAVNLLSSAIAVMLVSSAEPIIRIVYGPKWGEAESVFLFLSISMFATTPINASGWAYVSLGQTDRMLRWALFVTPAFLLAFLLGLPYGPAGVALGYSVTMCLAVTPAIAFMTRRAPIRFRDCLSRWLPIALVGGIAAVGTRLLATRWVLDNDFLNVALRSSFAITLYFIGLALLLVLRLTPLADLRNDPMFMRLLHSVVIARSGIGRSQ